MVLPVHFWRVECRYGALYEIGQTLQLKYQTRQRYNIDGSYGERLLPSRSSRFNTSYMLSLQKQCLFNLQ